jgi:diadenosine tetraphosphate (Ap4A) HIT family hydrolase
MDSGLATSWRRNDKKKKGRLNARPAVVAAPASRHDACRRSRFVATPGDQCGGYPWLILVPRRTGVVELADLGSDAFPLTAEIGVVSLALKELTRCDKINIAAIGNVVPQLHVHIVARRKTDPLWPKPVFGVTPLPRAKEAAFERFVDKVRKKLGAAQMR